MPSADRYQFGSCLHRDGTVTFRVWAPACTSMAIQFTDEHGVLTGEPLAMQRSAEGVFSLQTSAEFGSRYWFRLPDGTLRPDPASRFQPDGVHGCSQVVDVPARDPMADPTANSAPSAKSSWSGVPRAELILYEMHLGSFTRQGTYLSAIDRLPELVELGVTAIELMPIAQSAGARNWGYDGVNLFAPRDSYGTPNELRQFVDAAHHHGLAVILDVVYNHFGPEGNYLHLFGGYISSNHSTVWGDSPNFDGVGSRTMRDYIIANAIYWIEDYGFDGLRLDAIHHMVDDSPVHIVTELGQAITKLEYQLGRHLHLIAESNVYDPALLVPLAENGHGFGAVWCDDFVHSVFAILRPGEHLTPRQYQPHSDMDMVLRRGFVFQGGFNVDRKRIPLEQPTPPVSRESVVFAIQNHDFIGNHPQAKRLHQASSVEAQRAAAALLLMYPAIPMLFMGEEFNSNSPFYFFADFGDAALRKGVEDGRRQEFPQHNWDDVDSPLSGAAFTKSYIGEVNSAIGAESKLWYRDLIRLRKQWRAAGLLNTDNLVAKWNDEGQCACVVYRHGEQNAFAVVRLHSVSQCVQSLAIDVSGEVLFSQACQRTSDASDRWILGEYGVAIGVGTIALGTS